MRMRRTACIFLAFLVLASALALFGCTDGEETQDTAESEDALPPQEGLEAGVEAPDFRLKNQDQQTVVLGDYRGSANVILIFYPLAFTPV